MFDQYRPKVSNFARIIILPKSMNKMHKRASSASIQMNSGLSNLSLDSIEEDETEPWHGLIHKLSPFHLDLLHAIFKEHMYKNGTSARKPKAERGLSKEEFVNAVDEIFDNCKYSLQATILFSKIDKEDNHKITWDQFLDFVIENSNPRLEQPVKMSLGNIFPPPHVKRETIYKIVLIETEKYFCYAILSKYGRVGLYDGNMNFLTSYHIIISREDITKKDEDRRRRNTWITDAVFLEDVQIFVITTSARNITIYDASGLKHVPLWLIISLPNVINCLTYHSKSDQTNSILFMGDDKGQIISMSFLQPKNGFLRRKHNDKLSLFYWIELQSEIEFVSIRNYGKSHDDNVRAIRYSADNNTIISCSRDANSSVVIKHPENRRNAYKFKMERGTTCFSISRLLKQLVTGSDDGTIRLWNIVVTSKPVAILKDHQSGIVDVQIMEQQQLFISVSRDGILKLWSMKEQKCIQTLNIKFPSFSVLGKIIEWGINAIYPGPKKQLNLNNDKPKMHSSQALWERSHIFVTCCNYMARVNLTFSESWEEFFDMPVLPHPPLQNSVLIPTNWKICNDSINVDCNLTPKAEVGDDKLSKHVDSLKFILSKDLLGEDNLYNHINYQIATLEAKKLQMQNYVSQGAPYLALDLYEVAEIKLSPNLPLPKSKRIRSLVDKTQRMLSAATARSHIFSEASSSGSRTRSSRSSLVSFD